MILLREKITRLGEIFNRRHNVILHRVARTINASRGVLKKADFYNRNPRFKHGQKGRVCPYGLSQANRAISPAARYAEAVL